MCFQIRGIIALIAIEMRGQHNIFKDATHALIHIFHAQLTTLHARNNIINLLSTARFHKVVARLNLINGVETCLLSLATPVGHDDAFEAPIIAKYLRQEVVVGLNEYAVDTIIRRHYRPRMTFAHGNFKSTQIDFAGCTL